MNQILNPVSSTMLMLCRISLNPFLLEGGRTTDPLPRRSFHNGLEFLFDFWVLLAKLPQKHCGRVKFKIYSNLQINPQSLLTHLSQVQHSI